MSLGEVLTVVALVLIRFLINLFAISILLHIVNNHSDRGD